jgi:glycosyltransferase involved in cell wall biosynthesis
MTQWLFVGPVLLSGIGQVMHKYSELFSAEYVSFNQTPTKPYDRVFAFIIPQPEVFEHIIEKFKPDIVMTVCETEPVHKNYKLIFDTFPIVLTPSEFCRDIFLKQFPGSDIRVFPHWPGNQLSVQKEIRDVSYTFYTIGNVIDPRKNIRMLIEAFMRCNFGDNVRLVIKATCVQDVKMNIKNVTVINGLLDNLDIIHDSCDCYVNCSYSEGVGMGAVEAAIRDKPVIISDFGGLKEYVKTPFVIESEGMREVGMYDFLFEPHMKWGNPKMESLIRHMKYCFENNIRKWNHKHTRDFTSGCVLRAKLSDCCLALTRSSV